MKDGGGHSTLAAQRWVGTRNIENERLLAEMIEDPSIKNIARKLIGSGTDAA